MADPRTSLGGRAARIAVAAAAVPAIAGIAAAHELRGRRADPSRRAIDAPRDLGGLPLPSRDLDGIVAAIAALPQAPRPVARTLVAGFHDWPLMLVTAVPELALAGWTYPLPFRHRVIAGAGGVPIAALFGLQPVPARPGVVVVHGAMTTKHFDYVRRTCLRLYRLGFHVAAIDMRGFGVTAIASDAPSSLGWEEGGDVLAAARLLRAAGATGTAALGFSLGGTAVLCAARRAGPGELDGGVLAFSTPIELGRALRRLSERPSPRARHYGTWLTLRTAAMTRARATGLAGDGFSLLDAVERFAAPWYGLPAAELIARSSPDALLAQIGVPTLLVHAENDPVIPVDHARVAARLVEGSTCVRVVVLPRGGHASFDAADPAWTAAAERAFLGALAARG